MPLRRVARRFVRWLHGPDRLRVDRENTTVALSSGRRVERVTSSAARLPAEKKGGDSPGCRRFSGARRKTGTGPPTALRVDPARRRNRTPPPGLRMPPPFCPAIEPGNRDCRLSSLKRWHASVIRRTGVRSSFAVTVPGRCRRHRIHPRSVQLVSYVVDGRNCRANSVSKMSGIVKSDGIRSKNRQRKFAVRRNIDISLRRTRFVSV